MRIQLAWERPRYQVKMNLSCLKRSKYKVENVQHRVDGGTKKKHAKSLEEDTAIMPSVTVQKHAEKHESSR